jgi:hypothetical protein
MKDKRKLLGWVLTAIIGLLFTFSGVTKLMGAPEVLEGFQKMGLGDAGRYGIAITELLCVLLFIIPRTGVLGVVLLIGYMGGTIMAHIQGNLPFAVNIVIGLLIGITGYIRFPELGSRLFGKMS